MLGIGVDIIRIDRLDDILDDSVAPFRNKVFTAHERKMGEEVSKNPAIYFAKTFAAKEAIFKCFGIGWESGVELMEIEVYEGEFGQPLVRLSGRFAEIAAEKGVTEVLLSLSYDGEYAVAIASLRG